MIYPDPNYFDYSASAPPFKEAMDQFVEVSTRHFANPSSIHKPGKAAKRIFLELKEKFCDLLNFNDGRLLICSTGTEANNTIVEGYLKKNPGGTIIIAENVHESIWYATKKHRANVNVLNIDKTGKIDMKLLNQLFKVEDSLVCISHACNETGAIEDVEYISQICSERKIKLHIDGVQAIGHIPVDMSNIYCDSYSFSAHKFGGSRSLGGLLIRDESFEPLLSGAKQEWGLRAGTESPGGLAAAVKALEISKSAIEFESERLNSLKKSLLSHLKNEVQEIIVNSSEKGLPGFLSISFPGFSGSEISGALSLEGYSVSTGSACHENKPEPSRVIMALGRNKREAMGTIRITMGRGTTEEAVTGLGKAISSFIKT